MSRAAECPEREDYTGNEGDVAGAVAAVVSRAKTATTTNKSERIPRTTALPNGASPRLTRPPPVSFGARRVLTISM
jgi:hypothetical protein